MIGLRSKKWLTGILSISLLAGLALTAGCGSSNGSAAKNEVKAKTYYVATRGTFKPFTYMDDKGELTGYDIEILKEVQKRNKDIKFEFKTMTILPSF